MNNIKIMSRIKPTFDEGEESCVRNVDNNIFITKKQKRFLVDSCREYKYSFDKVFSELDKNIDIYNYLSIDILKHMIKKKKDVIFYVYGHTGAGKSHTIIGKENEYGFLPMILSDMIQINDSTEISLIEIYNNKCYDLINNHNLIQQREDNQNNFNFNNISKKQIKSKQNIFELNELLKNRRVGKSSLNETSSRSHLLIDITFSNKSLKIIDLAGCEKAKKNICQNRAEFKENGEINQSLFVLKECIRSLASNKKHIPYRRSELTKLLRQSFDPANKTYILSAITQNPDNSLMNIDILNYVSNIKNLKITHQSKLPKIFNKCLGSPRYINLVEQKYLLDDLNEKENNLLNQMFVKQSTKNIMTKYINVIEKKKSILNAYNLNADYSSIPKPPQKLFQNRSPKIKDAFFKE